MSQDNLIHLECSACSRVTHDTHKNKKIIKARMLTNKHCKFCVKHTPHKETK
ncbi:MAG: 50S ribosomal protein L33 [Patescibacteria group bacterium]